jgi:poly(A) polymerase
VHKKNFLDDPLRILRAFSLSAIFRFKIDKQTLKLIQRDRKNIAWVSGERIRDELLKILETPRAFDYLVKMDKLKVLDIIIPEIKIMRGVKQGPYHHLDVWQHSLETLRQLEGLALELKNNKEIQAYLDEIISSDRKRMSLLKLGALLHDIGKPGALRHKAGKTIFHGHERLGRSICEEIIRRLKFSNDELEALNKMVFWHLRPGYLADNQVVSKRAKFRYFRDTGSEGVSVLLLSIADQRATRGRLTSEKDRQHHEKICLALIKEYFRQKKMVKLKPLINGDMLMKKFKLKPSPLIGKILSELEELQAIGKIKTKEEALKAAKRFIK